MFYSHHAVMVKDCRTIQRPRLFNPRLFNHELLWLKIVGEKSVVVDSWSWKIWGWDVIQFIATLTSLWPSTFKSLFYALWLYYEPQKQTKTNKNKKTNKQKENKRTMTLESWGRLLFKIASKTQSKLKNKKGQFAQPALSGLSIPFFSSAIFSQIEKCSIISTP